MNQFTGGALISMVGFGSLVMASMVQAAPEKYVIDNSHTYPYFSATHMGWSTTRGLFTKTSGSIELDLAAKKASVEIVIDANSIDTAFAKRDEHLRAEDFLDVAKYPTITFKSDRFEFDGDKPTKADGQLTLRGITKPVSLTFVRFKCGENPVYQKPYCGADATATIKRGDFGITGYEGAISEEIQLLIAVEAVRADAQ